MLATDPKEVLKHPYASFGDRMRGVRHALGLTQEQLAAKLGVSRAALGQWEIDKTIPSNVKIEEISNIVGITPEWLAFARSQGMKLRVEDPADAGMIAVPEIVFGDGGIDDRQTVRTAKLHRTHLPGEVLTRGGTIVMVQVNSDSIRTVSKNDFAFVDTSDTKVSPEGDFCYWDGLAVSFASIHMTQSRETGREVVIKKLGMDAQTVTPDTVQIVGRVVGGIVR